MLNKCNLFSYSGAIRLLLLSHVFHISHTIFFPSKPWLINYTLAAHSRWLLLKCAVSFDWTHESHTGFISSGWRSSSRTRSPLRIFTDDLQAHFHSRQLLPRHFLHIRVYTNIPPCEASKRQKGANMSWKQTEAKISVQVPTITYKVCRMSLWSSA